MKQRTRATRPRRSSSKNIYVARTVELPQDKFKRFLGGVVLKLGKSVEEANNLEETHLTFLSTDRRLNHHFRNNLLMAQSDMARRMQDYLDKGFLEEGRPTEPLTVSVNRERPVKFMGKYDNVLVLDVELDERLAAERRFMEEFVENLFEGTGEEMPPRRNFVPHITVARLDSEIITDEVREKPDLLFPENFVFPKEVMLNGLRAYLGNTIGLAN